MKGLTFALCLLISTTSAFANDFPSSQWKSSELSLFELVQSGYNIVAVTNDPNSGETFFLQKSGSAYKCAEVHADDVKARKFVAPFNCWELVKPYVASLPK
ncbi:MULTISPECIES: hypothetical protein [unclassified Rhodanobacter]|uniref:Uncharacterized protein n=1 Tax=Rhodanobacter humi TaxID=1888173 RepID=A0ABV4ANF6_9GAMM